MFKKLDARNKMKDFSVGTICGLVLGVFLVGYTVFAYISPTQSPPEVNTEAPLNVGLEEQQKQGELWLDDGLIVGHGLRLGNSAVCDQNRRGTLIFNASEGKPYICDGSDWNDYKGAEGDTGDLGPEGETGETGAKGAIGDRGPQGPRGAPDASYSQGYYYSEGYYYSQGLYTPKPPSINCGRGPGRTKWALGSCIFPYRQPWAIVNKSQASSACSSYCGSHSGSVSGTSSSYGNDAGGSGFRTCNVSSWSSCTLSDSSAKAYGNTPVWKVGNATSCDEWGCRYPHAVDCTCS